MLGVAARTAVGKFGGSLAKIQAPELGAAVIANLLERAKLSGDQIGEVFRAHRGMKKKQAREKALEMMQMVGIPDPKRRLSAYPHEMSGGMAQRVMIAMALACEPELLIADDGPGFPAEKLKAPIEGLSTTKPNGTGLGLYTSECLIRASGGTLERHNRPTGGAQLRILLPRELR